jgi:hypothetical protein
LRKNILNFLLFKEYNLYNKYVFVFPQDEYGFEIFDLRLSILFNLFNYDNLIQVILAIMSEAKIVFISENYGLLTPIIQVILYA